MIEFQCPICSRVLKIAPEHAGEEGACRYCGGRIVVPTKSQEGLVADFPPAVQPNSLEPQIKKVEAATDALNGLVRTLQTQLEQNRADIQRLTGEVDSLRSDAKTANKDTEARLNALQSDVNRMNEQRTPPAQEASCETKACPICAHGRGLLITAIGIIVVLAVVMFVDIPVVVGIRETLLSLMSRLF